MYYDTASDLSDGSGIVVKRSVGLPPSWYLRVYSGLPEDIESDIGLFG